MGLVNQNSYSNSIEGEIAEEVDPTFTNAMNVSGAVKVHELASAVFGFGHNIDRELNSAALGIQVDNGNSTLAYVLRSANVEGNTFDNAVNVSFNISW